MARIRSLVVSDPRAAEKVLQDNAGVLGSRTDYDQINRAVKGAVIDATMAPATDQFVSSTIAKARALVGTPVAPVTPVAPSAPAAPAAPVAPVEEQM
jgi:hypothetical protein